MYPQRHHKANSVCVATLLVSSFAGIDLISPGESIDKRFTKCAPDSWADGALCDVSDEAD